MKIITYLSRAYLALSLLIPICLGTALLDSRPACAQMSWGTGMINVGRINTRGRFVMLPRAGALTRIRGILIPIATRIALMQLPGGAGRSILADVARLNRSLSRLRARGARIDITAFNRAVADYNVLRKHLLDALDAANAMPEGPNKVRALRALAQVTSELQRVGRSLSTLRQAIVGRT